MREEHKQRTEWVRRMRLIKSQRKVSKAFPNNQKYFRHCRSVDGERKRKAQCAPWN